MRHRVTFLTKVVTKDPDTGANQTTYTQFATVWGEPNPTGGRKFFDASRLNVESLETLSIRYLCGLNEQMQLQMLGRNFEILNIQDVQERRIQMMLAVRELK
jgi:SPP1 family predicted phage head-tail adaptor